TYWLRAIVLAFAPLFYLLAARYRACIRSALLLTGCALSRLHSLRSFTYWLRAIALAFAPLFYLLAARYRACIRSALLLTGCALSRLHSLRSSTRNLPADP